MVVRSRIAEDIPRKFTHSWKASTRQKYHWLYEQWCSFCCEKGLPVLEVYVNGLVKDLNLLQVSDDYAFKTLCQLVEQMTASTTLIINNLLGVSSEGTHHLGFQIGPRT